MICHGKITLFILFLVVINTVYSQNIYTPVKTTIVAKDAGFILLRSGRPYFIKGAGGTIYSDRLAKYGGNSIRTWDTKNGEAVLNKADSLGLTVTMGLNVARERHGFDYNDSAAVNQQLENLRWQFTIIYV